MTQRFKVGADFDAAVRAYSEANKTLQAIATETADYSKKVFEHTTRTFEKLVGAKSWEQAIEIQSQYAKKAYDDYVIQVSKLGEMFASLARTAYAPVEKTMAKKAA
jgi:hypothetical protein